VRIASAQDRAFGFYYPDDLAALRAAGAELVPIDTLHDANLPPVDGLFIGGGFPEVFMQALQANASLRAEIADAIEAGLPTHAECGGLMYLARSLTWQGPRHGQAIPGDAGCTGVGRSCVHLQGRAMPGAPVVAVRGHEFHHSSLENLDPEVAFAYRVQRGHGVDGVHDGVLVHNLLASYAHLRSAAGASWARDSRRVRRQREASTRRRGRDGAPRDDAPPSVRWVGEWVP
jgi:cobyrinic acid a,c-diamide synthase